MEKSLAVKMFGSQSRIARELGVSRSAVHQWSDPLPAPRAAQIREHARKLGLMEGDDIVAVLAFAPTITETPVRLAEPIKVVY